MLYPLSYEGGVVTKVEERGDKATGPSLRVDGSVQAQLIPSRRPVRSSARASMVDRWTR
jgi:hypothetical protein